MFRPCLSAAFRSRLARGFFVGLLHCLWLSSLAEAQSEHVQPIDWSRYSNISGVRPDDAFGQKLVDVIQKQSKYVMQEIHDPTNYIIDNDYPENPGVPFYYAFTAGRGYEQSLRPLSNFAYGMAVMLQTGIYDGGVSGVSADNALDRAILAINGVALCHRSNRLEGYRWGGRGTDSSRWQAAYWAAQTAVAAWMLWDELPSDTQRIVANMVEYEADSSIYYNTPYWRNPDGTTNFPGDTKAEENSWNGMMPAMAQAMMPNHPHVNSWREKASELQVSAYSIRPDNFPFGSGAQVVDGKQVHEWINGYNMFDDGIVVNHSMVQPDYMIGASTLHFSTALNASLAEQYIPNSTFYNADLVFEGLTEVLFTPGQQSPYSGGIIVDPGGTMFPRTGSGENTVYSAQVYYPEGADWVRTDIPVVFEGYLNFDLYAEFFGWDDGEDFDAMGWANARVDRLVEMQARSGDARNIYQPGDWMTSYFSQEGLIFLSMTQAWMQHWLMSNGMMSPMGDQWGALPVPGDANGDGSIDDLDAAILADHWGAGNATWAMGDFDRDGVVGPADASILAANWQLGTEQTSASVPVPCTALLAMLGAAALLLCGGRARSTR